MPTAPTSVPTAEPISVTAWSPPTWTEHISTEGDVIEAFRILGSVPEEPRTGDDVLPVIVLQRDEIRSTPTDVMVLRYPVEILVGGVSLTRTQAEALIELLSSAIALIGGSPE